jgi:hypothetical protein
MTNTCMASEAPSVTLRPSQEEASTAVLVAWKGPQHCFLYFWATSDEDFDDIDNDLPFSEV